MGQRCRKSWQWEAIKVRIDRTSQQLHRFVNRAVENQLRTKTENGVSMPNLVLWN